jgi:hypothetical protein
MSTENMFGYVGFQFVNWLVRSHFQSKTQNSQIFTCTQIGSPFK